eukprot:scaffold4247_cov66-Cylindrotheca_fusiformis.AAC.17
MKLAEQPPWPRSSGTEDTSGLTLRPAVNVKDSTVRKYYCWQWLEELGFIEDKTLPVPLGDHLGRGRWVHHLMFSCMCLVFKLWFPIPPDWHVKKLACELHKFSDSNESNQIALS